MLPQRVNVEWKTLAMLKGLIPRHNFIMWLALHQRLTTVDRLGKWGIQVAIRCVLYETTTI